MVFKKADIIINRIAKKELIKRKSEMAAPQRKNTKDTSTTYPITYEGYVTRLFKTQVGVNWKQKLGHIIKDNRRE